MGAIISECGNYRYRLDRDVSLPFDGSKVIAYFGVNPSTADASIDDATVRKWRGFTQRNGGHKFIVGNLFSFRSTDVKELFGVKAKGNDHYIHVKQIISEADILVPCWGNRSKMPYYLREEACTMIEYLKMSGKPILHFGLTASGDPKHPLMLGYNTELLPWTK